MEGLRGDVQHTHTQTHTRASMTEAMRKIKHFESNLVSGSEISRPNKIEAIEHSQMKRLMWSTDFALHPFMVLACNYKVRVL